MKIIQINSVCGHGSTGLICVEISKLLTKNGVANKIFYFSGESDFENAEKISDKIYIKLQALKSRFFGNYGFNSQLVTKKLIKKIKEYKPDVVHIHNIHGHDCNLKLLFNFFKQSKIKLIWTFHDCWAFTGYCPHFAMVKCDKWKEQCVNCQQKMHYSWLFDKSKKNYELKKTLFGGLDLTIVTPSLWLADLVKLSFLKEYPVQVINNGIDLSVYKPIKSDFREHYNIQKDDRLLLGVAFGWGERKGLDVFLELSKRLPGNFKIVLVGTDKKTDKTLPDGIISIHKTQNQNELAEIYTAADLFVNPTREEVLGLVNVEALACGTPVITFRSGGSPECIDETCGSVIDTDDINALEKEIIRICKEKPYSEDACITRAKLFDKNKRFQEYIDLYGKA